MMQSSEDKNKSISVNIAILTVSDTRTINNDKSGDYLVCLLYTSPSPRDQ